jgi:D-methionine transport system substrate-binding protein
MRFLLKFFLLCLVMSCSQGPEGKNLKVAASATPHAEMLEFIKPDLKKRGINLIVIVTDDYQTPNRALFNGDIDANFFQHLPFLQEQVREFEYPIVSFAKVELEPMGLYSKKIHHLADLADLKENSVIAIPNDPTNEARALLLMQSQALIELKDPNDFLATPLSIKNNPKNLKFIEVDAAMLPRTLDDVDAALINTNYALQAGLNPLTDALLLEKADSPYANILAIRSGEGNRADLIALKNALTSEKMRTFIKDKYKGAVIPAF